MDISDLLGKMDFFIDFSIFWNLDFSKILKSAQNFPKLHGPKSVIGPRAWGQRACSRWGGQKTQKNPKTHRTLKLMVEYPQNRFWAIWGSYVDFRPLLRGNISFVIFSLLRLRGRRRFCPSTENSENRL